MQNVKEVTPQDFNSTIATGRFAVDFWAPWCGPCKSFGRAFEEAATIVAASPDFKDVQFIKVNIESDGGLELCKELGISNIPVHAYYSGGLAKAKVVGTRTATDVIQLVTEKLA